MNPIRNHYFLFALLVLMVFGCRSCDTVESNKVAQTTIYQDYSIVATRDSTSVSATFRVGGSGGTTLDLNAPSKIEYNGKGMTENLRTMFGGTNYSWSGNGFQNSHQFAYTDGDGRVFQNGTSFEAIELVPGVSEIDPKLKTIIQLSRPLRDNESLETSVSSLEPTPVPVPQNGNTHPNANTASNSPAFTWSIHNNLRDDKSAIEIDHGSLKNFVPGKAVLRITVEGSTGLQHKTETGGRISYTYTSQDLDVTIMK